MPLALRPVTPAARAPQTFRVIQPTSLVVMAVGSLADVHRNAPQDGSAIVSRNCRDRYGQQLGLALGSRAANVSASAPYYKSAGPAAHLTAPHLRPDGEQVGDDDRALCS
jgi:hypothetical protein